MTTDTVECDINIASDHWDILPDIDNLTRTATAAAIRHAGIDTGNGIYVSFLLCGDDEIHDLNRRFRNIDKPTNVLSFPQIDGDAHAIALTIKQNNGTVPLGDIAISYDTIVREADDAAIPLSHHYVHMVVHGVLHLLGYDHINDRDAAEMEGMEIQILQKFSITDPYQRDIL